MIEEDLTMVYHGFATIRKVCFCQSELWRKRASADLDDFHKLY